VVGEALMKAVFAKTDFIQKTVRCTILYVLAKIALKNSMNVSLLCTECDYQESASSEKELMNRIIMWNHVKGAHVGTAERIMRIYKTVPNDFFRVVPHLGAFS
jgi:predicted small metal-binding protein